MNEADEEDGLFLTAKEVEKLTGIRRGKNGKNKFILQCEYLRKIGVAFYPNARGRPIVPRPQFHGQKEKVKEKTEWRPAVLNG